MNRRIFPLFILLVAGILFAGNKLYIFYPSVIRPQAMQKQLKELFIDWDITVFGRYRDFIEQVNAAPPEALLTRTQLLNQLPGYSPRLHGVIQGSTQETYVLISIDTAFATSGISGKTIGAVDFLGREGMMAYITGFINASVSIKTVPKIEDMLPLLSFGMVDALFIPDHQISYFQSVSTIDFRVIPLPNAHGGIAVLSLRKGIKTHIIPFPAAGDGILPGVEQWR